MLWAVAPTRAPQEAMIAPAMMKYLLPKISDSCVSGQTGHGMAKSGSLTLPPTVTMTLAATFQDTLIHV